MKIALFGRVVRPESAPYIQQLVDQLRASEHPVSVCESYVEELAGCVDSIADFTIIPDGTSLQGQADILFSLGGDGTILHAATVVRDSNIPIMGVNIGRLGFLSSISKEQVDLAMAAVQKGTYVADRRTLLHVDSSNGDLFGDMPFGLNEFTIHKKDSSSMVTVHVYINGEFMSSYWADGLIIATPTGSTGYSLSCGGPIVFPNAANFVVTAIAPHNLSIRPLVVPDDAVITLEVEGRSAEFLATLDSRMESFKAGTQLAVRKERFSVSLVRLDDTNFLHTLRGKLNLGVDTRNRA
jgi:NAD+ kinase